VLPRLHLTAATFVAPRQLRATARAGELFFWDIDFVLYN